MSVQSWPRVAAAGGVLLLLVVSLTFLIAGGGSPVTVELSDEEDLLGTNAVAELTLEVEGEEPADLAGAHIELNGVDVTDQATASGSTMRFQPGELPDGDHELSARVPRSFPRRDVAARWQFTVDNEPPELNVTQPGVLLSDSEPVSVSGQVEDPEATVLMGGQEIEVTDGTFQLAFEQPPAETVTVEAVDEAGNVTSEVVTFPVVPSRVEVDEIRGVHVSASGWADEGLRSRVLELIDAGLITTVQLDIKNEGGVVGYPTQVPLAEEIGARNEIYDLAGAVEYLHDRDIHVVGRIVAFADPVLAPHAWEEGDSDMVVQTADGEFYTGSYAGFTNFAHPDVRAYNIDLAVEAARMGVDGILWDYVRRPDGAVEGFSFAGLETEPEQGIVGFLAEADARLAPYEVEHGASVYGIAASRPEQIAQDIPAMAEHLDYVAPMIYPSHWGPGEYGVPDPIRQPYDITHASLADFQQQVDGSRARVVGWLQDFSMAGVDYGPEQVHDQMRASADLGINEWLLWNASNTYTREAMEMSRDG